jgi:hypothetical protein
MKQNKLVIAVLVVIAVLFVLGLSSDFFRSDDDKDDDKSISKVEKFKDRWLGALDDMMAPFQDSLDSRRLPDKAICPQPPRGPDLGIVLGRDGSIKLDNELECSIKIAASKDDEDLESAILTVGDSDATLMVAYPGIGACPTSRGMRVSFKKMKTPMVASSIGKLKRPKIQPKVKPDSSPPRLSLTVAYIPKKKGEEQDSYCKAVKEVKLSILKEGGRIEMKCTGCDRKSKKSISVKLK